MVDSGDLIFRFGAFELDVQRFELRLQKRRVEVQPKVLETLIFLVQHRDRLVTKEELIAGPWQGTVVSDAALSQVIMHVRRTLDEGGSATEAIRTVRGKGFRFLWNVHVETEGKLDSPHVAAAGEAAELGSARNSLSALPFVGREPELDQLERALREARAAQGSLVLVGGDPGIGKSRLVARFADRALAAGVNVLWGHCWEAGGATAFGPWLEIVRDYLEMGGAAPAGELPPLLLQLFPDLSGSLDDPRFPIGLDSVSPQLRFRVFHAMARFLRRAASRTDLALVIEDVHAGDDPSLSFLSFLAQRVQRSRLLVVATYRAREAAERPGLADLLNRVSHDIQGQVLAGLSEAELGDLVQAVSGRPAPRTQISRLHALTGGNPFFALELLRDGATRERLLSELSDDAEIQLPGLGRALSKRLAGLPPQTLAVLQIGAVLGNEFPWTVVQAVHGAEESSISALEPALCEGILRPSADQVGVYRFAHALIRDALYRALSLAERMGLHARVAQELESLVGQSPGILFQIADHYRLAAPQHGAEKAIAYGLRAADQARHSLAYEIAIAHYRSVLELIEFKGGTVEVRAADVHVLLARAQECLGQRSAALDSFQRAAELARSAGAHDSFARAVLGRFGIQHEAAMADEFVRQGLSEALGQCREDTELKARLLAADAVASGMSRSPEERWPNLDKALTIARGMGKPDTLAWVLSCLHRTVLESTTPQLLALAGEMVQAADRAGVPDLVMDGHLWRATYLMRLGRVRAYEAELNEYERLVRAHPDPFHQWQAAVGRVALNAIAGDLVAAEIVTRQAHDLCIRLDPLLADAVLGAHLFMIALQHDSAERLRLFREAHTIATRLLATIPRFRTWAAVVLREAVELGEVQGVQEQLPQLVEEALQAPLGAIHRLNSLSSLVPVACAFGDSELVLRIYESMRPFAGLSINANHGTYFGQVNHYLASLAETLGNAAEAREHGHAAELEMARIRPSGPRMRSPATLGPSEPLKNGSTASVHLATYTA